MDLTMQMYALCKNARHRRRHLTQSLRGPIHSALLPALFGRLWIHNGPPSYKLKGEQGVTATHNDRASVIEINHALATRKEDLKAIRIIATQRKLPALVTPVMLQ